MRQFSGAKRRYGSGTTDLRWSRNVRFAPESDRFGHLPKPLQRASHDQSAPHLVGAPTPAPGGAIKLPVASSLLA
jgi:hypothetical protein